MSDLLNRFFCYGFAPDGSAAKMPAAGPGEAHLGEVGGNSDVISPSVVVSTNPAYSSGDNVGGILTLANAMRLSGGKGILQSLLIVDKDNQKPPFDILLFDSNPSGGTYTDNAAIAGLSNDVTKLIRRISVAAADYVTVNGVAIAEISSIGKVLKASGSANLFAVINTTGTPTWTGTGNLIVRFGFLRD